MPVLISSALFVGFVHTLIGVDHTLPFIVLARARSWSLRRTIGLTFACGLAHVLSSVVLGGIGIGLGLAVSRMQWIESIRGDFAAWVLVAFGLLYAAWSFAGQRRRHRNTHSHAPNHAHVHDDGRVAHSHHHHVVPATVTATSLFIVFVLGPCEPLIPLMMAPAIELGVVAAATVVVVFGLTTIATMMSIVCLGYYGLRLGKFSRIEPHMNTISGIAIALSGVAIKVWGI